MPNNIQVADGMPNNIQVADGMPNNIQVAQYHISGAVSNMRLSEILLACWLERHLLAQAIYFQSGLKFELK